QLLPPQRQSGQIVTQGLPRSPTGVPEPLPVLNAERAWSNADGLWLLIDAGKTPEGRRAGNELERANIRRYTIRAIGRVEDPSQVRRLLALPDVPFTPTAEAIAQSLYGFDPRNDPQLIADVAVTFRGAIAGQPGSTRADRTLTTASMSRAVSHLAYATEDQVAAMEVLLRDALSFSTSILPAFREAYLSTIHGFEALARVNTKLVRYDADTIELLEKAARGDTIHGEVPDGRQYAFM